MRFERILSCFILSAATCASTVVEAAEPKTLVNSKARPWAAYKVIDIHAHIGSFTGHDLRLETLLKEMDSHAIRMAFISNIDGAAIGSTKNLKEAEANTETEKAVRAHPTKLRGLLWARPNDGSPAKMESFLKSLLDAGGGPVFVGIKFHPEYNSFSADDAVVDSYLKLCAKYRIPAVFHCGQELTYSSPASIYAVARRHPMVPIVLYHMGFTSNHDDAIKVVKESVRKKDADLYLETSQCDGDAVLKAIKEVGAGKVLFGTDATYWGVGHYERYDDMVKELHDKLSRSNFNAVMHENAERLFHVSL